MARKPNYDFERRERERLKAVKVAERAKAKLDKTESDKGDPDKAEGQAEEIKQPTDD